MHQTAQQMNARRAVAAAIARQFVGMIPQEVVDEIAKKQDYVRVAQSELNIAVGEAVSGIMCRR